MDISGEKENVLMPSFPSSPFGQAFSMIQSAWSPGSNFRNI